MRKILVFMFAAFIFVALSSFTSGDMNKSKNDSLMTTSTTYGEGITYAIVSVAPVGECYVNKVDGNGLPYVYDECNDIYIWVGPIPEPNENNVLGLDPGESYEDAQLCKQWNYVLVPGWSWVKCAASMAVRVNLSSQL